MCCLCACAACVTAQIGDRLPHMAFAQDLDEARDQYNLFSALSEKMVAEFARVKEQGEGENTAFPCTSAAILPKADAFACGAAVENSESLLKRGLEDRRREALSDKADLEHQIHQTALTCGDLVEKVNQTMDGHVTELNQSVAKNWNSLEASIHGAGPPHVDCPPTRWP